MDPRLSVIDRRLEKVENIIAVSGGKGGIGKSIVAAASALILAENGRRVGLLDLDFCGPCAHIILGTDNIYPEEEKGIVPPKVNGINFMSITSFTAGSPWALRGSEVSNAITELLAITQWGMLDYLFVDMPPGLGDPALDAIRLIKRMKYLLVAAPSKVALDVMKKELQVLKELDMKIIGILENMKRKESESLRNKLEDLEVPFLGSLDYDAHLEEAIGNVPELLKTGFARQLREAVERFI
ncbi:MAG TPA: ATP-binding protein [Desulfotomaculum sp.]|nr:MAG: ATPase [Desulfotomaculum sp. 46_80]KUK85052.1 MAG: ATPase [Desulfofundulus kuznetsovii]HAG10929.1 ATP-binding protein [Desulfotomaculum sp.]HBY03964.1 ATP-binding protein [Desulfotomaculum sp.]